MVDQERVTSWHAKAERLDRVLVARGLAPTRARAADMIRRGIVRVDGAPAAKPGQAVAAGAAITVAAEEGRFVSRAALKLAAGLDHFGLDPKGRIALDVGAATGGFSEILLARGAAHVHAVDVGHGQLHPRLARDPRLTSHEGCDARTLTPAVTGGPVGAITLDVSFISATKVLGAVLALAGPGAWLVVLVKPQFEVGRSRVGRGGIVRDGEARAEAVARVAAAVGAISPWRVLGSCQSPLTGKDGNIEHLLAAVRDG
jgi:23S rRNA (cytidine1920-2'-O)/16S rRNA (cytidine1409-2'-O)-methyltransferase